MLKIGWQLKGRNTAQTVLTRKTLLLAGAVTGLENRHSVALKGFFDFFSQNSLNKTEGMIAVFVQGNLKNPPNIVYVKLN
jgi:hypothetical protein